MYIGDDKYIYLQWLRNGLSTAVFMSITVLTRHVQTT